MRKMTFAALASAFLLATAGAAFAEQPGNTSGPVRNAPGMESPQAGSTIGADFGASLAGATVYNRAGDPVGIVKKVSSTDRLVVSLGNHLGIGAKDVVLVRPNVQLAGTGSEQRLITILTPQQLGMQPEADSNSR